MTDSILRIHQLTKHFGGLHAVENCSFSIEKNSIVGLIGPNGAGKTTVFNLLTGLLKPDRGAVHFNEHDVTHWPTYKRAQVGLARTFQMIRIFPQLTVLENITVALKDNRQDLQHIFFPQKKRQARLKQEALKLLKRGDLDNKADLLAGELSYGQQKILEILRSLAVNPSLMLLDEPAAGINRSLLKTIEELIRELKREGKTIVIIEHDMNFIMSLSEKIIVMDRGKEIAEGTPKQIQNNPKVLEAYLGQALYA